MGVRVQPHRSRGGEGFAFVIHNDNAVAMGVPNSGMGYQGIRNAIAIEFDTWCVSVGWRLSTFSYLLLFATAVCPFRVRWGKVALLN